MGAIRVGISGWTFPPWRGGVFYPKGLVQKKELEYASRQLTSIEVNGTFYSIQKPHIFKSWHDQTPADFVFSIKAPQYLTHVLRLKDCEKTLNRFLNSGLEQLGPKLGPILWQFPPNVTLKDDRFEKFFDLLERTDSPAQDRLRHAFEFRHPSFLDTALLDLMRAKNLSAVFSHALAKSAGINEPTADFIYLRMHGEDRPKGYTGAEIKEHAGRAKNWAKDRDVFIYFSCDQKEYSPQNALEFLQHLK